MYILAKKNAHRTSSLAIAILLLIAMLFAINPTANAIDQTLNQRTLAINSTDSVTVNGNETIIFTPTSSSTSILTVDLVNNQLIRVTGVGNGNAFITFYRQNSTTGAQDKVTVPYIVGTGGTSNATLSANISVAVGASDEGSVYFDAYGFAYSDSTVASAQFIQSSGRIRVTGLRVGTTTITGKYKTSITGTENTFSFNVTVTASSALSSGTLNVTQGQQLAYDTILYDSSSPVSDNASIATTYLSNNRIYVTGVSAGTTVIRANARTISNGPLTPIIITVNVTGSAAAQTLASTTIQAGKSVLAPQFYSNYYSLNSDNNSIAVATWENGQIKIAGLSVGQTNIRARVRLASSAVDQDVILPVVVTATAATTPAPTVSSPTSTDPSKGIYLGSKKTLTINFSTTSKSLKSLGTIKYDGVTVNRTALLWVGSNDKVIQVNKTGTFKVVGKGKANLIALTATGAQTAYVEIEVK